MSAQPPGRIPFEHVTGAKSWLLPEVNGDIINSEEQRKRKTQIGQKKAQQQKRGVPESPVVSEELAGFGRDDRKAITAQQLEEITQAAEQDGFEKGYSEGVEQGKLEGRKAGYSEGLKAGTEQAQSEHGQWLKEQGEHLQQVCEALMTPLASQQQELADAALDLAMGLAKHILASELAAAPEKLIALVDRAIAALPPVEKDIAIYLHPEDAQAYKDYSFSDQAPFGQGQIAIREDPHLDRGGCRVTSEHSFIDYSVGTRLSEFAAALQDKPFDTGAAEQPIPSPHRGADSHGDNRFETNLHGSNPLSATQNVDSPSVSREQHNDYLDSQVSSQHFDGQSLIESVPAEKFSSETIHNENTPANSANPSSWENPYG
jgi:flagellar assembly protein FliH